MARARSQYQVVKVKDVEDYEWVLIARGNSGWRLAGVLHVGNWIHLIFERDEENTP